MSYYLSNITNLIQSAISQFVYIGNNFSDYPGIVIIVSLWVIVASIGLLKRILSD